MTPSEEDRWALLLTIFFTLLYTSVLVAPAILAPRSSAALWTLRLSFVVGVLLPMLGAAIVVIADPPGRRAPAALPYWAFGTAAWHGARANHDFCEENFSYSPYIAEFHNTWSSLPIVFVGSVGVWNARRYVSFEARHACAFIALGSVGVGSTLFHGTLLAWGQVLDEAPMMFFLFVVVFCLVECEEASRFGALFPLTLCLACFSFIGVYLFFNLYAIFLFGFGGGTIAVLIYGSTLASEMSALCCSIAVSGLLSGLVGAVCWFVDDWFCASFGFLRLHIGWHVFTSLGCYMLLNALMCWRADRLGQRPRLRLPTGYCVSMPSWDTASWVPCDAPIFFLPHLEVDATKTN